MTSVLAFLFGLLVVVLTYIPIGIGIGIGLVILFSAAYALATAYLNWKDRKAAQQ